MKKVLLTALVIAVIFIIIIGAFLFSMLFFVSFSGTSAIASPSMYKNMAQVATTTTGGASAENIGLSTGGAKDINNFYKNIENNYLPLPTDITYEGLFYNYFFDTGETKECTELFCPSYTYAISNDPISQQKEYYISVGLNSGIKETDFHRKKLNLVIVLDNSGSMGEYFDKYYYDASGNRVEMDDPDIYLTKMKIAENSIVALLDHLEEGDRFGMVTFSDDASLIEPLKSAKLSDIERIKNKVLQINTEGSTQMSAGMKMGTDQFKEFVNSNQTEYENRIIFLTDAMPNVGEIGQDTLLGMLKANADKKIYTTFIGIGVDFNTELVNYITKIRGANYYSVHSPRQFKERMDEEFEYMVTPLVFNLLLKLDATGYKIDKVYGSPEADESTGELMKVNTLFPSKKEENQTKGGLVLLKLSKISSTSSTLKLKVSYEDREGKVKTNEEEISIEGNEPEFFENTGIRKGILLTRYANLMKDWIIDERRGYEQNKIRPFVDEESGIVIIDENNVKDWQRQSMKLKISDYYKNIIRQFKAHFEKEMNAIDDNTLSQETAIMDKLINL